MKLITGANGFIGRALRVELARRGIPVRGIARTAGGEQVRAIGNIGPDTDWVSELHGVDTVIHTAARVHKMDDPAPDPIGEYRRINTAATLNLARQASAAGVKRFIFISSIKVNGESTCRGERFTAEDIPKPADAYAISKWEAEQGLNQIALNGDLEIVIIRPPLVYGPGARANMAKLIKWVKSGIPLPVASIRNRRSLIALDNLVDLIITCIDHPAAANQTLLAADGEDLSTAQLITLIAICLGKPDRIFGLPPALLTIIATISGKRDMIRRLCSSLQIDMSRTQSLLGWQPPISVAEAMCEAVRGSDPE